MIIDLGLNQGIGVDMDEQTGEGTLVGVKTSNPHGRSTNSAGADPADARIAERVRAEPSEEMVKAAALKRRCACDCVFCCGDARAVIAAYRKIVLEGE